MALALLAIAGILSTWSSPNRAGDFSTVGLYVWRDTPSQHAFWKACGINTLQFCDSHWSLRADDRADYDRRFAADVYSAKRSGFRVFVILFSNISQWTGPAEREPSGTGVLFDPRDRDALGRRLADIARAVHELR